MKHMFVAKIDETDCRTLSKRQVPTFTEVNSRHICLHEIDDMKSIDNKTSQELTNHFNFITKVIMP